MLIINYYTPSYADFAADLIASIEKRGYRHNVKAIELPGRWLDRARYKPTFIRDEWRKADEPVLWIDADAVIEQPIDWSLFDNCDFAGAWCDLGKRHLNAGVVYFAKTEAAGRLLDRWVEGCKALPDSWDADQTPLQLALEASPDVKSVVLPNEYCWIEPIPGIPDISRKLYGDKIPVIRQRQASRTHR